MPHVNVGDVELYCKDEGTGRPVMLLHGMTQSSRAFAGQVRPLVDAGFRAVVPDLRFHGRSPAQRGFTVASMARDVRGLIERLDLDGVVLGGHSLGATIVWSYVEQFGTDRLAATIDIGQGPTDLRYPDWPHATIDLDALRFYFSAIDQDLPSLLASFLPTLTKEPLPESVMAAALEDAKRLSEPVAAALLADACLYDARAVVAKVDVPTLICIGSDDAFTPLAAGEWLVASMPDARLVVFESSAHSPHLEEPERFNDELIGFVRAL